MAKNVGPTKLCSETIRVIDAEKADRKPVTLAIDGDRQLLRLDFLLIEPDAELAHGLAQRVTKGYNGNERIAIGHGVAQMCPLSRQRADQDLVPVPDLGKNRRLATKAGDLRSCLARE